jgi:hypothetical protein
MFYIASQIIHVGRHLKIGGIRLHASHHCLALNLCVYKFRCTYMCIRSCSDCRPLCNRAVVFILRPATHCDLYRDTNV